MWRGLKGRPDLFAQYIACFKKSTYRKVFKEAVSPDLISFMFSALRDHCSSSTSSSNISGGASTQIKALSGFSAAPGFTLALSLLPEQDLKCVHAILHSLSQRYAVETDAEGESENEAAATVRELCSLYGV